MTAQVKAERAGHTSSLPKSRRRRRRGYKDYVVFPRRTVRSTDPHIVHTGYCQLDLHDEAGVRWKYFGVNPRFVYLIRTFCAQLTKVIGAHVGPQPHPPWSNTSYHPSIQVPSAGPVEVGAVGGHVEVVVGPKVSAGGALQDWLRRDGYDHLTVRVVPQGRNFRITYLELD